MTKSVNFLSPISDILENLYTSVDDRGRLVRTPDDLAKLANIGISYKYDNQGNSYRQIKPAKSDNVHIIDFDALKLSTAQKEKIRSVAENQLNSIEAHIATLKNSTNLLPLEDQMKELNRNRLVEGLRPFRIEDIKLKNQEKEETLKALEQTANYIRALATNRFLAHEVTAVPGFFNRPIPGGISVLGAPIKYYHMAILATACVATQLFASYLFG